MLANEKTYKALDIRTGEESAILLFFCYSFFMGAAVAVFYTATTSLFLIKFDRAMLPIAYMANGLIVFLLGYVASAIQKRISFSQLTVSLITFLMLTVTILLFAYQLTDNQWFIFLLFLWNRIFVFVNGITFWTTAAKVFNLQQAKRLFGLISTGDVISSVLSYLSIPLLLTFIQTDHLLYLSLISLIVCMALMVLITRKYRAQLSVTKEKSPAADPDKDNLALNANQSYYSLLFLLALLPVFGLLFVDYVFFAESKEAFPDKETLASFLGIFFGICAVIEFLIKTFLYGRIIQRYGLRTGIMILPVALLFSMGLAAVYGIFYGTTALFFAFIVLSRFFMSSVRKSINDPSFQILLQPIPAAIQAVLQNRIEGRAKALGTLLIGALLLLLTSLPFVTIVHLVWVFLIILGFWAVSALRIKTEYYNVLKSVLASMFEPSSRPEKSKEFYFSAPEKRDLVFSKISFDSIIGLTGSKRPKDRLRAVMLLDSSGRYYAYKYLISLLQDEDPDVRNAANLAAGSIRKQELWPYLIKNLYNPLYRDTAASAIQSIGEPIIKTIEQEFNKVNTTQQNQLLQIDLLKGIEGEAALRFLRTKINHPTVAVRDKVIEVLAHKSYRATVLERPTILAEIDEQIGYMVWLIASHLDLEKHPRHATLLQALEQESEKAYPKIFSLLAILYGDQRFDIIQGLLQNPSTETRGYLFELLNITLSEDLKPKLLPLFEESSLSEKLRRYQTIYPQQRLSVQDRIKDIIYKDFRKVSNHTKAVALQELLHYPDESTTLVFSANAYSSVGEIAESALSALQQTDPQRFNEFYQLMEVKSNSFYASICQRVVERIKEAPALLAGFLLLLPNIVLAQPAQTQQEMGLPFVQVHIPKEYNAHSQNFGVTQDDRDIMYFANFAGVLEYDGVNWQTIQTKNVSKVSALYTDTKGRVFIGANGEFGYLNPDSTGKVYYENLSDKITFPFGEILKIFGNSEGIYFVSRNYLFRWTPKGIETIKSEYPILSAFYLNSQLYVFRKGQGLSTFTGTGFRLIPLRSGMADLFDVTALLPNGSDALLLVTSNQGLFRVSRNIIDRIDSQASRYMAANQPTAAVALENSRLAIATLQGGIVILNDKGDIRQIIRGVAGLQDVQCNAMFSDNTGILWLALNNGIAKVDISSPLSLFTESNGLKGSVRDVIRHNGKIYVATLNGLFTIDNFTARPVPGLSASCFSLIQKDDILLVATSKGIYQVSGPSVRTITTDYTVSLTASKVNPSRIYTGQQNSLGVLEISRSQGLTYKRLTTINDQIAGIVEDKQGIIWLESLSSGLYTYDPQRSVLKNYTTQNGLSTLLYNRVGNLSQGLLVWNKDGIYRYDKASDRFSPYNLFQTDSSAKSYWKDNIIEDSQGNFWTTRGDEKIVTLYKKEGQNQFSEIGAPFLPVSDMPFTAIYPDAGDVVWFGGPDGLVRYDNAIEKFYNRRYHTLIRKITLTGEKTIYNGFIPPNSGLAEALSNKGSVSFEYSSNDIGFEFTAASFNPNEQLEFQYYLENYDNTWSDWTTQHQKEYTNLPPGRYKFHVRSRNGYASIGDDAIFAFSIITPLYLRWWAIGLYLLILGLIVYLAIRWRLNALVKEKQELESLIQERTEEVVSQKIELEKQSEEMLIKNDQLEKIDLIVQAINAEINFSNLFQTILSKLRIIRNMDVAAALIYEKQTNSYKFRALLGSDVSLVDQVRLTLEEAEARYLSGAVEVYEDIYYHPDISARKWNTMMDKLTIPKSLVVIVIRTENHIDGFISLGNMSEKDAFNQRDFDMLKNLKEHLVSAYIKTRLLENLETTLENLKSTQEELIRQERLASVGQLTKGIVDRILNPLNYINNFSDSCNDLIDEVTEILEKHKETLPEDVQDDVFDELNILKNSLIKISDHGNSTTRIVKDMQKLLREKSREFLETELTPFLESKTVLALQEVKNEYKDFSVKLIFNLEKEPVRVKILPYEFGQVISNVVSNSGYALYEKSKSVPGFQPELYVSTKLVHGEIELTIRDNGKGIPQKEIEKLFSPFFTTKPTSKGTGLGLFMSKDIVQMHKGSIAIKSQEGEYTEIRMILPALQAELV